MTVDVSNCQFIVKALYKRVKSWRRVAAFIGGPRSHNYWRLLSENSQHVRIELDDERHIEDAWQRRAAACTACTERNKQRKNITVSTSLYRLLDAIRSEKSLTWNEVITMLLERMEG